MIAAAGAATLIPEFDAANHAYTVGGVPVPSVTQIIQGCGIASYDGIDAEVLRRKAAVGTLVHEFTAMVDRGEEDLATADDWPEGGFIRAWAAFRRDTDFTPDLIESQFAHDQHGMRYAGTVDRFGLFGIGDAGAVIELKTSSRKCAWWGLQLMGYALAVRKPARVLPRRLAVQLRADGRYEVHEFRDPRDEGAFMAALAVETWKRSQA